MQQRPYPRWQRRHEAVLSWLFENPSKKLGDCAVATGYSRTHLSRIINSPEFCRRYSSLRRIHERVVSERAIERLHR